MTTKEKLRTIVAGAGWGKAHATVFTQSEHCDLRGLWSRSDTPENRAVAAEFGVELFTDFADMLDRIDPHIVSVAVPEVAHAQLVCQAIDHGCHVYCEKVLSDSVEAAQTMVDRAAGLPRIFVPVAMRFGPILLMVFRHLPLGTDFFGIGIWPSPHTSQPSIVGRLPWRWWPCWRRW